MVCCKRKGDVKKCIPFYVIGGLLILVGLPLMTVGIVGQFVVADLLGYIGGICILFGIGFLIVWHMFTIENIEKLKTVDAAEVVDRILKDQRVRTTVSATAVKTGSNGFTSLSIDSEKSKTKEINAVSTSVDPPSYSSDFKKSDTKQLPVVDAATCNTNNNSTYDSCEGTAPFSYVNKALVHDDEEMRGYSSETAQPTHDQSGEAESPVGQTAFRKSSSEDTRKQSGESTTYEEV